MNTEYSRILFKRSTVSGVVPTIPTGTTIDNTWLTTDILVGESFLNTADDRLWFRTDNGIIEVNLSGLTTANYYTTGATLVGDTIYFDRTDQLSAYTVDLSTLVVTGGTGNYLPLTVTGTTFVDVNDNLLYFTGNTGTSITTAVVAGDANDITQATVVSPTGVLLASQDAGSSDNFYAGTNQTNGAYLEYNTGGTVTLFKVNKSSVRVQSAISNFPGITYDIDYSANYSARSLVDKGYVDGLSFSGNTSGWIEATGSTGSVVQNNGTGSDALANYSLAANSGTTAQAVASSAFNEGTTAKGQGSASFGKSTFAGAPYSFAHGDSNYITNTATNAATLGGRSNTINGTAEDSVIIGGTGNTVQAGVQRTIVLGGKDIVVDRDDTVYVPALVVTDYTGGAANRFLGLDASNQVVTASTASIGVGTFLPLSGGVLTGPVTATTITVQDTTGGASVEYIGIDSNGQLVGAPTPLSGSFLPLSGGTLTGALTATTLAITSIGGGTPTINLGLDASGNVVTGTTGIAGSYLPTSGGTITGNLVSNSTVDFNYDFTMAEASASTFSILNSGATARQYFDYSGNIVQTGVTNSAIVAGSGNTISSGLRNVFVAGVGITASANDTAYFSNALATTLSAETYQGVPCDLSFAISDESTAITTGATKLTIYAPYAFTITAVKASLSTSGSTSSQFDVNVAGSSIFSTNPTIDANEFSTSTAAVPSVISASTVTADQKITIDIDSAGTGAKGAKIYILGKRNS